MTAVVARETTRPRLSLILPVFRSELNIPPLLKALDAFAREHTAEFDLECVFVVDGSPDDSRGVLLALLPQYDVFASQVHDLSLPSPIVTPRAEPVAAPAVSSITPRGARGYEMAIRMARSGASIEEIVASCGTTRSEARLLRRLHCAGGATAA